MAGFKLGRTSEDIRRELMDILRNMKDPRISGGMFSIVRIELTNDISHCKVYVSSLEGMEKAKEAVKVLGKAAGFIRHENFRSSTSFRTTLSSTARRFRRYFSTSRKRIKPKNN